mmetsp:Transcript_36157/g.116436  ORF Transcript_36157/g.116436 Transcript_36157/m.116436 type:complete len:332 (+) Transcript_36157:111-1106(+)
MCVFSVSKVLARVLRCPADGPSIGVCLCRGGLGVVGHRLHLHTRRALQHPQVFEDLLPHGVEVLPRVCVLHGWRWRHLQRKVGGEVLVVVVPRQVLGELLPQHHRRLVRPAASDVADRVPAPPQHKRRQVVRQHVPQALGVAAVGQVKAAEPVARERVGAALQDERAGAVEAHHLLHHRLEQPLVRVVVHPVAQRHVDRVVLARPDADVLDVAGAGKEEVAVLVKGDRHHAVRREEGLLDAVAVVDVDVQVEHASVHLEQLQDREYDVVDVAEAGRLGSLRVVQSARPVDRDVGSASVEAHRAVDRSSRVQAAVVVQAVKDGAVVADGEAL